MTRRIVILTGLAIVFGGGASSWGQNTSPGAESRESMAAKALKLGEVLKSSADEKAKADACRELARIGTKDSVAPLASLLGDEKLNHMARYGLEPIADPAVDDAFRAALEKLKGRPLVGVIGSIGVRRDAKALDALAKLVGDSDGEVAQAAARALGSLGSPAAAKALEDALAKTPAANQPAVYEGLFRCAEASCIHGQSAQALPIYDRLAGPEVPKAVREGAARRARLLRQEEGRKI
jgi:hypothetical protein